MTPLVGLCFDLFGRRMWFVSATAGKCLFSMTVCASKADKTVLSTLGRGLLVASILYRASPRPVCVATDPGCFVD